MLEMCEIYIEGKDEAVAEDIFRIVLDNPGSIVPKLVNKSDGHKAVTVAFSNPQVKKDVQNAVNTKYGGMVSFR